MTTVSLSIIRTDMCHKHPHPPSQMAPPIGIPNNIKHTILSHFQVLLAIGISTLKC